MDEPAGRRLGSYTLEERIGLGRMGAVFRARRAPDGREVAVKVLQTRLATDEMFVARFKREARIAGDLHHPNIVETFEIGEDGGVGYIAMALVEGEPLQRLILRESPLPLDRVLAILRPLASAIDYAHARGVIHRDLKPANVIVGPDGRVTLLDFGLARALEAADLTRSGMVLGTPVYMAPEALRGERAGRSNDLYALGVIAFEMLTGRVPYEAPGILGALEARRAPPPAPRALRPDLSVAVERAILCQLAVEAAERFTSARDFVDAIEAGRTAEAPAAAETRPARADAGAAPAGRGRAALWLAAVAVALAAFVAAALLVLGRM